MNEPNALRAGLVPGTLAGLAGGLVFGAAMLELGVLPTVASLVRADSAVIGFLVHMLIAAVVGAGFGALMWRQRSGAGEGLFWGLTYGALWWFLGPLTLMRLLLSGSLAWDVPSAQAAFPSLPGHLLYGGTTGLAFVALRRKHLATDSWSRASTLLRGALAGLMGAWLLGAIPGGEDRLLTYVVVQDTARHYVTWLIGLLAGAGFALLYPHPVGGSGAGMIRGALYGFWWWVAGSLTVIPLVGGGELAWPLSAARAGFAAFPGYLLLGAGIGLFYRWLDALVRFLFSDNTAGQDQESMGTQGLRAVGRGIVAGLLGGLLFTVVMVQVGFLPQVASLVGATSTLTGLIVHLAIASVIGVGYGLLFRRESYDIGSALGWGVSYGFFWWILGPLTLMPILLGAAPQWTAAAAAGQLAALVGHLLYGAGLGVGYYLLEARYSPWWIPWTQVEASRVARRKEQVLTSAPALWTLVVVIALTLPVVLGT